MHQLSLVQDGDAGQFLRKATPMRGRKPVVQEIDGGLAMLPKPPAWLSPEARQEWRRVAPELQRRRTLKTCDLGTLENYCEGVASIRRCRALIAEQGEVIETETGLRRHPASVTLIATMAETRRQAEALGLTPTSRHKVPSEAEVEEGDRDFRLMIA
jgi:P27 family predicted phage terminase small subunit